MRTSDFEVFPLTPAAGAEIQGLDLTVPLSEITTNELRQVWLQHGVLFFRNQTLDPKNLMQVAQMFGETMPYPLLKGLNGFPVELMAVRPQRKRCMGSERVSKART